MKELKLLTRDQFEKLLSECTIKEIKEKYRVHPGQVVAQMTKLGIAKSRGRPQHRFRFLSQYSKEEFQKMYDEAKSVVKLGRHLNVPASNLYGYFKKIGVNVTPGLAILGQIPWNKDLTKETSSKMATISTKLTGIKRTEEYKKNMSKVMKESDAFKKGNLITKAKLEGTTISEERRLRIISALTGKPKNHSVEGKQRIRAAAINRLLERAANREKPKVTDIEQLLQDELMQRNIPFKSQVNILDTTIPDIFIEPRTCIYADGDYFHLKPAAITRDASLTKFLTNRNYKVFRFWGSDIKKDVKKCVDQIENYIKNPPQI